jgi:hypothetical protein
MTMRTMKPSKPRGAAASDSDRPPQQSKQQNWASSLLSRRAAVQYLSTYSYLQSVCLLDLGIQHLASDQVQLDLQLVSSWPYQYLEQTISHNKTSQTFDPIKIAPEPPTTTK